MHNISHIVTSCTFFISVVWNIKMLKRFYSNIQIINAVHETVPVPHLVFFLPNFLVFLSASCGLADCRK
jgi:hypothetical protein